MNVQFIKSNNDIPLEILPPDFNWKKYIDLNEDVRNVYPSQEAATQHYLYEGYQQNRRYTVKNIPNDFNWITYLILNPDVHNECKTKSAAMIHYDVYGCKECRSYTFKNNEIPDDFDWMIYKNLNPSFESLISNELDATIHYYKYGKTYNLQYKYTFKNVPDDFDWKIYCELNNDIKSVCFNELESKIHYETDGFLQKRRYNIPNESIPDDFNWEMYCELNPDVKQGFNSEIMSKLHYHITGKNEDRIYKLNHIPSDFDCTIYIEFNNVIIPEQYKITDLSIKLHYELFGRHQNLKYLAIFEHVPDDFDCKEYSRLNPDISDLCTSENVTKAHYDQFGVYQCRKYKECDESSPTINISNYNLYPYLFHKYILGISKPTNEVNYTQICNNINASTIEHNMVAHLHCYNIDLFHNYYSKYMNIISNHCTVILVTFSIGNDQNFPKSRNTILIKTSNIGMDIGGKYICIDYFKQNNIKFKYILFLHSKQDDGMRKSYWEPLLLNMAMIIREIKNDTQIGIFIPPLIYSGDYANIIYKDNFVDPQNVTSKWNSGNSLYMNDLDNFFGFNPNTYLFPEGNCFVCNNEIAEILYGDTSNYNLLNTNVSFDAVWVKSLYGGRMSKNVGNTVREIFGFFRSHRSRERIYPNNLAMGTGHRGHADNMYEHSYERIVFKVVQKLGYTVKIMPWLKTSEYLNKLHIANVMVNNILYNKHGV